MPRFFGTRGRFRSPKCADQGYRRRRLLHSKQSKSINKLVRAMMDDADMAVEVEGATSATYYAAWAVTEKDPKITLAASIAKAWCSETYTHTALNDIHIHGGIGFTWDHDMNIYLKRAKSSEVAFGNADYHRERVARMMNL